MLGNSLFMGDNDDRRALTIEILEDLKDFLAGFRIEIARGFVGKNEMGLLDEGSCDGDPLLFAAGHLAGPVGDTILEPDTLKGGDGFVLLIVGSAVHEGEHHVAESTFIPEEVERLKNEADFLVPHSGQLAIVELGDVPAAKKVCPKAGPIEAAHNVHQSGFTGARGPGDCDELACIDFQTDFIDGTDFDFPHEICLRYVEKLDHSRSLSIAKELILAWITTCWYYSLVGGKVSTLRANRLHFDGECGQLHLPAKRERKTASITRRYVGQRLSVGIPRRIGAKARPPRGRIINVRSSMILMRTLPFLIVLSFLCCSLAVGDPSTDSSAPSAPRIKGTIVDAQSGKVVPARVYVTDSEGKHYFDPRGVVFRHGRDNEQNFCCDGTFEVTVTEGEAVVCAERGLEYKPLRKVVTLRKGEVRELRFALERWVNMSEERWFSGDLHGHRSLEEMPTLVLAEDVNVGSVITRHNQSDYWREKEIPAGHLVVVDDTHVLSIFDEEVEYLGRNTTGALIFIGMKKPIAIGNSNAAYPTLSQFADQCHEAGGFVDAEKPIWLGVAVSAALGQIDSIGIVNNHFHPRSILPCAGRWGEIVPEKGYEGNDGLALWCMELYYRLLNCGFRIPVSGGTASGIMPSPVGYSRVYVKVSGDFSYDNWVKGLKAGRSFATNGPILSLSVNGRGPGEAIDADGEGLSLAIEAEAKSRSPLAYLEIVGNGKVIARTEAAGEATALKLSMNLPSLESTWIVARAFEKNTETARFAHTSPVRIEVAGKPTLSSEAAAYYGKKIDGIIEFTEGSRVFREEKDRERALSIYRKAREVYAEVERRAVAVGK
jgi:hypothetical protein